MLRRDFCQVAGAATGWLLLGGFPRVAFANVLVNDIHLQVATDSTFGPGVLVLDISGGVLEEHYSTPLSDGQTYFWRQTIVVNNQHVQVYHGRMTDERLAELLDLYDDELLPFIEEVNPPLPVELTSFDYLIDNGSEVVLRWSTASESDNAGFEVEQAVVRSATEETGREHSDLVWRTLTFVSGAGTTTRARDYSFVVALKEPWRYAFRLKQIDLDGGFTYSSVLEVDIEVPRALMLSPNYPNPFNPSTRLTFTVPVDGLATVDVYNILGQQVARLFDGQAAAGRVYALVFDASSLSTGDYVAVLRFNGRQVVQRMVLLR